MAPVLLLLSVTVADVGRAFYFREAVTNAARQAIRVAAQPAQKGAATSACTGTSGNVTVSQTTNIPDTGGGAADVNLKTIANNAAIEAGRDGTPGGSVLNNSTTPTTITVTFYCSGGAAETNATATSTDPAVCGGGTCSDSVKVKITYSMSLLTPFTANLLGKSAVSITITETGRVEY
jgi:Flp pilus assembly protein TadG